jgi:hypothetical protein
VDDALAPLACVEWAREVNPEIVSGFDHEVDFKTGLPDVIATLDDSSVRVGDANFPFSSIQQRFVATWSITLSFMVDDSDPDAADALLKTFANRLKASALQDGTLGGRVPFISRLMSFDYTNPFVEYQDGTRGREMTMQLTVGELVEEAQ